MGKDSNLVYVDKTDGTGETCPTVVASWTNKQIKADSWRYPDGTVCAQPGDIVVVPCAAAEKELSGSDGGSTKPPKPCNGKKCK